MENHASQTYLEPCPIFTIELFSKNSERLAIIYFPKKAPL